jgi:HD-GYP domain-containing protein (c-di-GMP phosphodiesterase class II)
VEAAVRPHTSTAPDTGGQSALATLLRMLGHAHTFAQAHGERVSSVAVRIGRELGLVGHHLDELRLAGTLHDIGKLCVPVPIVEKRGPLSGDEWVLVRSHPVEGERLLRPFVRQRDVLAAVRWHHERWDGGGYPDGLRGAATPLCARIVAVADAYSAMTEQRPYRPPLSARASAAEVTRNAGTQFDRACASALVAALRTSGAFGHPRDELGAGPRTRER